MEYQILRMIVTLCIGCIGAYIASCFRIKAGAIIGSLFAVSLYGGITSAAFLPEESRIISQIVAGAFIGTDMSKEKIMGFKAMVWPSVFILGGFSLINLIMGSVIYYTTSSDWISSLLATTPGGIETMTIIAYEMGGNTSVVLIFQFARFAAAISLLPIINQKIIYYLKKDSCPDGLSTAAQDTITDISRKNYGQNDGSNSIKTLSLTLILAVVGGIIGNMSGLPAAVLVMSIFFTSALKIKTGIGYIPVKLKLVAQVLSGTFIGCKISPAILQYLTGNLLLIFITMVGYVFLCGLLGFLLSKLYGFDLTTALFCCTPAGISDTVLVSSELGAESEKVALLQLIRTIVVLSVFPAIINFLL